MLENKEVTPQKSEADQQKEILMSIFGDASSDAFDQEDEWTPAEDDTPAEPQGLPAPVVDGVETKEQPQDNDSVRYQYWQSEAQKREAELARTKAEADYYKRLAELQDSGTQEPETQETERFPDPPAQPKPPAGYNVEDALNNPQSPSYAYAQEYQDWYQKMFEYQTLKSQYLEAVMQEKFEQLDREKQEAIQRQQQQAAYTQQINGIRQEVMQKYNIDERTAADFIEKMSAPESLTIDNLFKLYSTVYLGGAKPTNQPTGDFQQAKVAEQFGPGFNKLPSGTSTVGKKPEDQLFDAMLAQEKQRTDW